MKSTKKLKIEQFDRKLSDYTSFLIPSGSGWVNVVRTAINMSFRQLGSRLSITPQSAQEIEVREQNGSISLKNLKEVAEAMNMKLVYGFIPCDGSLDAMLEKQALIVAKKIVMRTDNTMKLEDQQVDRERVQKAIRELADEIKREMPRYLWD